MGKDDNPRFADPDFQIFYYAPTVVFIFGEKDFPWTDVDCGIAVESMALAAEGMGIGSFILAFGKRRSAWYSKKRSQLRFKRGLSDR